MKISIVKHHKNGLGHPFWYLGIDFRAKNDPANKFQALEKLQISSVKFK